MTSKLVEKKIDVILREYEALREEIMLYISAQHKNMFALITVSLGQIAVFFNSNRFSQDNDELYYITLIFLFAVPFIIFILFIRAVECTEKVIIAADYIHKGIKKQLIAIFGEANFFEWEEHKSRTVRLNKVLIKALDRSKWLVFVVTASISFALGVLTYRKCITPPPTYVLHLSLYLILIMILISLIVANVLNEADGESLYNI
jgi:hypothetical protein